MKTILTCQLRIAGIIISLFSINFYSMDQDVIIELDPVVPQAPLSVIKTCDNKIVKMVPDVLNMFSGLKERYECNDKKPVLLTHTFELHCSGQDVKSLLACLSMPDKIEEVTNYDEAAEIVHLAKVLGIREELLQQLEGWLSGIASPANSPQVARGCLDLSCTNRTSCIGLNRLANLSCITKLILRDNCIERFDLKNLLRLMPYVRHLNLSHNLITKLRRCMLEGLPSGCYLNLSDNPIERLGSGVMSAIAKLRDKSASISLYRTRLPVDELESMEHSLSRISSQHLATKVGLIVLGGMLLASGIMMKAYATNDDESGSSDAISSSSVVSDSHYLLNGFAIAAFILAPCVIIGGPITGVFQHDVRESRLYWHLLS